MKELQRQGEIYLASLLTASIAADQRAMTMSAVFAAVAAGLAAAAATMATVSGIDHSAIIAISIMAGGILFAGLICAYAAKPVTYYNSGYEPLRLLNSAKSEKWLFRDLVESLEKRIADNKKTQGKTARLTMAGYIVAIGAIVLGAAIFVALRVFEVGPICL